MERYVKEIAKELKMIRMELQLENDLLMQEMGKKEEVERARKRRPDITRQLNHMFGDD